MSDSTSPEPMNTGCLATGFALGLIVGVVTILPRLRQSGRELRQSLFNWGKDVRESVRPVDSVAESIERGKSAAREKAQSRYDSDDIKQIESEVRPFRD